MLSFNVPFQSLLKPVKAHLPHTKRFPLLLVSEHGLYNRLVKIRLLYLASRKTLACEHMGNGHVVNCNPSVF
jgi:hypothetical protein